MELTTWRAITNLGDSAVTLPLVLAVAVGLGWSGAVQAAGRLVLVVGLCGAVVAGVKLLFGTCGGALAGWAGASPSGHVALSAAVYGSLAVLLGRGLPAPIRRLGAALAAGLIALIALSRLVLAAHSPAEVIAGLGLGGGAVALFVALSRELPPLRLPLGGLCAVGLAVLAATHGLISPAERYLRSLSHTLRNALPGCW